MHLIGFADLAPFLLAVFVIGQNLNGKFSRKRCEKADKALGVFFCIVEGVNQGNANHGRHRGSGKRRKILFETVKRAAGHGMQLFRVIVLAVTHQAVKPWQKRIEMRQGKIAFDRR